MPYRESKQDHARIFSDGFLKIATMYDPNSEYSIPEIEEDAVRIAEFIAANTSSCFSRKFRERLNQLIVHAPLTLVDEKTGEN